MADRLYYTDARCLTFDASVTACTAAGDHYEVQTAATAFYPTSGGQPHDTGHLGAAAVVDVIDDDTRGIVHVVDCPLEVGAVVEGRVDWPRRFDHMQQHTGQHVLSAAFEASCGARTESFHLGTTSCTIDLAREVTPAEISAAEAAACDVVWQDRPVTVRFASEAEAAALPLRKESQRTGTLRLVDIEDYDLSACGGTHVERTGMIGIIAVAGWERSKGGSRIEFVCGRRALASHGRLRDEVATLVRQLTVAPHELSDAVSRMQTEARTLRKQVSTLQQALAEAEASALVDGAEDVGPFRRVVVARDGWDAAAVKALASALVATPGLVAVVIGSGTPAPLVVARSADVAFDAGACVKALTAATGGRGGGRPDLGQGAVADAAAAVILARETVR